MLTLGTALLLLLALGFTRLDNATVEVPGHGVVLEPRSVTLPTQPQRLTFYVRRVSAGQASTVHLVVTDRCGDWPTFVGGGPNAF